MVNKTSARLAAVEAYLEGEFPGQVEEAQEGNVFIVSYRGTSHHVVLEPAFLKQCPDYVPALQESELADYLRETREQARRFLVIWTEHDTRIRSTPM